MKELFISSNENNVPIDFCLFGFSISLLWCLLMFDIDSMNRVIMERLMAVGRCYNEEYRFSQQWKMAYFNLSGEWYIYLSIKSLNSTPDFTTCWHSIRILHLLNIVTFMCQRCVCLFFILMAIVRHQRLRRR